MKFLPSYFLTIRILILLHLIEIYLLNFELNVRTFASIVVCTGLCLYTSRPSSSNTHPAERSQSFSIGDTVVPQEETPVCPTVGTSTGSVANASPSSFLLWSPQKSNQILVQMQSHLAQPGNGVIHPWLLIMLVENEAI